MGLKYSAWRRAHTDNIALFALCYNLQVMKMRKCYVTKIMIQKKSSFVEKRHSILSDVGCFGTYQSLFQSIDLPINYIQNQ